MGMRLAGRAVAVLATLPMMTAALPVATAGTGPTTLEILERFDRAQQETATLVARFTEEKHLRLLARPLVSRGRFFYNRPNQVRWEYEDPQPRVFVITEDHYTAYFPGQKKAESVEIRKFVGKRLFRFLAVGQSSRDLARYYEIARALDHELPDTHLLVLTPRKDRVRERLAVLRLWIDTRSHLPRRIAYEEPDGDSTILTFQDLSPNLGVGACQFRIDLPPDVQVSSTFNGLGLSQGGAF